ncbi:hypothetical protein X907_0684 [Glycocaulis alkaliphilus]|uniref:Fe-S protein n=2 Tax=Glycocaulis alkaliphilus TaxID=1434191 RepID=A0A3T0E7E3_9PROT|nr:hypothetical protein X907_0684 [Glycocaulis alkaliphilus]
MKAMNAPVWSPCIKVCFVDPREGICVGCFRTMEELGRWTKMSEAEREAVKPALDERRSAYETKVR